MDTQCETKPHIKNVEFKSNILNIHKNSGIVSDETQATNWTRVRKTTDVTSQEQ